MQGLIGVADAQVGDGERENGAALLGPVETWPAGELDDLAAAASSMRLWTAPVAEIRATGMSAPFPCSDCP